MQKLYDTLKEQALIYVCRDAERALGVPANTEGYHILTNSSSLAQKTNAEAPENVHIETSDASSTRDLLNSKDLSDLWQTLNPRGIVVFKNTASIERRAQTNGYKLLNPPAALAERIESKITQTEWLGELTEHLIPYTLGACSDFAFEGIPFVLQFNTSHTGGGTHLIDSSEKINDLHTKFPDRPVKKSALIEGPVFTSNNIIAGSKVLIGNPSYQITGISPFTENPFASVGNDWALTSSTLSDKQKETHDEIVRAVGKKLTASDWKGLFGIDVIIDATDGRMYLLEINARQPASAVFESHLQTARREAGEAQGITVAEAHLASLLDIDIPEPLIEIESGAQIIQRVTDEFQDQNLSTQSKQLTDAGFSVINYENKEKNSELMRIQSKERLMVAHNELSPLGVKISDTLNKPSK